MDGSFVDTRLPVTDLCSVQLAFSSRVRTYHAWQNADAHLRRTKQTHESNRAQGRLGPDQLSRSLTIVGEAERRALEAKQEFDHVSRLVKAEVARFEQERIEDFKNALEAFLEGMIKRQKQVRPHALVASSVLALTVLAAHRVLGELPAIPSQAGCPTEPTASPRFPNCCDTFMTD